MSGIQILSPPAATAGRPRESPRARSRAGPAFSAACDAALDLALVGLAAWTVAYHVCVVLRVGATYALGASVGIAGCASWFVLRGRAGSARAEPPDARTRPPARSRSLAAVTVGSGIAAALLFAFTSVPWTLVWLLWVVAAGCAVAITGFDLPERPQRKPSRLEPVVVLAWAAALAALSLFVLEPDGDDAYYVHLSAWISAHATFPLRDVLYSNQSLPSLFYPPVSSYEALIGALGYALPVNAQDLVYYGVPPLTSALSVLALWRLLRRWGVRQPALALSMALTFLLLACGGHQMLGAFFVGRIWQGKVIFLTLVVPLLFALLHDYAERPSGRGLFLLASGGAAGVGLTTTAIFVVPAITAAGMTPLAARSLRSAVRGFVAAAGYPLATALVTLAIGGRQPDVYTAKDVVAGKLIHFSLGHGVVALVAFGAILIAPVVLRGIPAAAVAAWCSVVVALLFSPVSPRLVFALTGLGRVLWRLAWALPVAALVGACSTGFWGRRVHGAVRALAPVAVMTALLIAGQPIWRLDGATLAHRPVWKVDPIAAAVSRQILAMVPHPRVVLAPPGVSETLVKLSGTVTAVSARDFYTAALVGTPAAHAHERQLLAQFAVAGLSPPGGAALSPSAVAGALATLDVSAVCVPGGYTGAVRLLHQSGFRQRFHADGLRCMRRVPEKRPELDSNLRPTR